MNRDEIQELRDSLFYRVQEIIRESVPEDKDDEENEQTYQQTDDIMTYVDELINAALEWKHDGVAFHLVES